VLNTYEDFIIPQNRGRFFIAQQAFAHYLCCGFCGDFALRFGRSDCDEYDGCDGLGTLLMFFLNKRVQLHVR